MNKKLLLAITLVIGIIVVFSLGRWLLVKPQPGNEVPTNLPDTTTATGTQTVDEQASVPVFLQEATELGDNMYQVTPFAPDTGYPFDILYNKDNGTFAVALTEEPIVESRIAVEEYLLSKLGVSIDELCHLPVLVTVPYSINQFYAGESLGLPSCPGSVPLE